MLKANTRILRGVSTTVGVPLRATTDLVNVKGKSKYFFYDTSDGSISVDWNASGTCTVSFVSGAIKGSDVAMTGIGTVIWNVNYIAGVIWNAPGISTVIWNINAISGRIWNAVGSSIASFFGIDSAGGGTPSGNRSPYVPPWRRRRR